MLPTQILVNSFLYDLAQITIPSDHVDDSYRRRLQHWDMRVIRDFMLFIGPISSIFDSLTFYVLLCCAISTRASRCFTSAGSSNRWRTQTLVLFVIRTMSNPFRSRPSRSLMVTTLVILAIGAVLPVSPLATLLGFINGPSPILRS
jgi:Mg2+-importing ATPase